MDPWPAFPQGLGPYEAWPRSLGALPLGAPHPLWIRFAGVCAAQVWPPGMLRGMGERWAQNQN